MITLKNHTSKIQSNKAVGQLVVDVGARLKSPRRRHYDSRVDIRSSLREGRTRFIPRGIFLCENRRLRALYIYLTLYGTHSSFCFDTKKTLLRKIGRSRSWWEKVISSPLFNEYFKMESNRLSIRSISGCHGMMLAFFKDERTKGARERAISFRENRKARIARLKKNNALEDNKNINITIQEDYDELRDYISAQDGRGLMLLSDRIGRKMAHVYGTTRSFSTDDDKRPMAQSDGSNTGGGIEGEDESGCIYSTSRKKNRERTGLSAYAQRKVESQNLGSIQALTERKIVFSGTPAEAYDFMSGYSKTYYGKPIKVDSRIRQSDGTPFSNVLVQFPNRYKIEGVERYQTLAYRPGVDEKGRRLFKNTHDRGFGGKKRYMERTMTETFQEGMSESSRRWIRHHALTREYKQWLNEEMPNVLDLRYILKTGILNRATIDLSDRNYRVRRRLRADLNEKLRGVSRLVGNFERQLDRLIHIKAKDTNPLDLYKYHNSEISGDYNYHTPKMTNRNEAGSFEADDLFIHTMDKICGKYNKDHRESLAESARRVAIYHTEIDRGKRKERTSKARERFSSREVATFAKMFGLDESAYAYYKMKLQQELRRIKAMQSRLELVLSTINNEPEAREKYGKLIKEESFMRYGLDEKREAYTPYDGDVLQKGCNMKIWDKRGMALNEKIENRLPLSSKEIEAIILTTVLLNSKKNEGMRTAMIKKIAELTLGIREEQKENPRERFQDDEDINFLTIWSGSMFYGEEEICEEEYRREITDAIREEVLNATRNKATNISAGPIH